MLFANRLYYAIFAEKLRHRNNVDITTKGASKAKCEWRRLETGVWCYKQNASMSDNIIACHHVYMFMLV